MNENILKYKGYTSAIMYSAEDHVLHGKIDGIDDLVDFYSETAETIEDEFHAAVDGYLDMCTKLGKEPNKTYSGSFNVRIKPELHRQLSIKASHNNNSLNNEVERAIENYLHNSDANTQNNIQLTVMPYETPFTQSWIGEMNNAYYFQGSSNVVDTFNRLPLNTL